jgi:pimeloyl-ACP methyl ester carboxylesterase
VNTLLAALAIAALLYAAVMAMVYFTQERLLFFPQPLAADARLANDADVHEVTLQVPGATLSALHLQQPGAKGVVFFLHGNAGNLVSWFTDAGLYRDTGYDVFMIDYRGYGKSTGRVSSEAQLHADVRTAWDHIAPQYEGRRRVVYGRSLGTALAARLAAEVQPDLTILVSPYSSMQAMARENYRFVPGMLLRYRLRTEDDVEHIRGPLLLVHADGDTLIGLHHSQAIQTRAPAARLVRLPGAGHGDLHGSEHYRRVLRDALGAL